MNIRIINLACWSLSPAFHFEQLTRCVFALQPTGHDKCDCNRNENTCASIHVYTCLWHVKIIQKVVAKTSTWHSGTPLNVPKALYAHVEGTNVEQGAQQTNRLNNWRLYCHPFKKKVATKNDIWRLTVTPTLVWWNFTLFNALEYFALTAYHTTHTHNTICNPRARPFPAV